MLGGVASSLLSLRSCKAASLIIQRNNPRLVRKGYTIMATDAAAATTTTTTTTTIKTTTAADQLAPLRKNVQEQVHNID